MSKSGKGQGDGGGKADNSADPGMAVIRRRRRSSVEKGLRGGEPEAPRNDPAAAWGSVLQREAQGEAPRAEPARREPAKPEPTKAEPARREPSRAEPARAEPARREPVKPEQARREPSRAEPPAAARPSPSTAPPPSDVNPGASAPLPPIPNPDQTSSQPNSRPSAPLPKVSAPRPFLEAEPLPKSALLPSTAMPEEQEDAKKKSRLEEKADRLAVAHDHHEARSRFRVLAVGLAARIMATLLLISACIWLTVSPALTDVTRAERQVALTTVLAKVVENIEADARLPGALVARNLQVLREIFQQHRGPAGGALQAAGFVHADENAHRVRLTDGGKSIALSIEFREDDGEVLGAMLKTGHPVRIPEVPALVDVVVEEYALNAAALLTFALATIGLLLIWPWVRGRRKAA